MSLNSLRSDARARDNDSIAERHGAALRCRENTQALDREHRQSAYKQRAQRSAATSVSSANGLRTVACVSSCSAALLGAAFTAAQLERLRHLDFALQRILQIAHE